MKPAFHFGKWVIPAILFVVVTSILAELSLPIPAGTSTTTPANEVISNSTNEPTVGITSEPTIEITTQPTVEITIESTVGAITEPTTESTTEPTAEITPEPTIERTNEPTVERTNEPPVEITSEPTIESPSQPTAEATTQPTIEITTEQAVQVTDAPTIEVPVEPTTPPILPPLPAKIIYVQSNGRSHELNLITSEGAFVSRIHQRAAAPAWSPDGTAIAFFGEEGISELGGIYQKGNGIWIIGAKGEGLRQLVAVDYVKNVAWSPDGEKIAFEIALLPHGAAEIRIVEPREGREISRFPGQQPAWHPNSQQLVIKSCQPDCGLWQIGLDGQGEQITFHSTDSYPSWSPTGEYLAFASERDGNWEIYRLRLVDRQLLNLTNRLSTDTTPTFSVDGREIYLRTDHEGGNDHWRITTMNIEGGQGREVWAGIGPSEDWGLARPAIH